MRVTYEEAVRKNYTVILKGVIPRYNSHKNERTNTILSNIKNRIPETMKNINKSLHRVLNNIDFINFWNGLEIHRVEI